MVDDLIKDEDEDVNAAVEDEKVETREEGFKKTSH
jgi:hypothetical protein